MELVSVFLPTFSRLYDGHLERAISSVLAQTYAGFELLIVDDASVDGSERLIRQFAKRDNRVKHIRMKRHIGLPAYLIGYAYAQSRGQLLAFMYDDCAIVPHHLETLTQGLRSSPNAGMVYGQAVLVWPEGVRQVIGDPYDPMRMAAGNNHIPNVSAMVKRHVLDDVGLYDPHVLLARYYDWDLWQRIYRSYPVVFLPEVIAEERGVSLPDSIGNTYAPFQPFLYKYVQVDRNKRLRPNVFASYDPYSVEEIDVFDKQEKAVCRVLVDEHFALVKRKLDRAKGGSAK